MLAGDTAPYGDVSLKKRESEEIKKRLLIELKTELKKG